MLQNPNWKPAKTNVFMTACQLYLTQEQYDALLLTLDYFEEEKIDYIPLTVGDVVEHKGGLKFNLGLWRTHNLTESVGALAKHECGTIACIGGTAEILVEKRIFNDWIYHLGLSRLFNPQQIAKSRVSVTQAAKALRNYLETGHPNWLDVVSTTK